MLNGDAHHSNRRDGELRILPLPNFQRLERQSAWQNGRSLSISFSTVLILMRWPNDRFPAARVSSSFRVLYVGNDIEFLTNLRRIIVRRNCQFVSCMDCGSAILFLK